MQTMTNDDNGTATITEDDLMADDWEIICNDIALLTSDLVDECKILDKGTTPWAIAKLLGGDVIQYEDKPLKIESTILPRVGPAFILVLPNGAEKIFRFSPNDIHARWTVAKTS